MKQGKMKAGKNNKEEKKTKEYNRDKNEWRVR
jgi:hypothetical protein